MKCAFNWNSFQEDLYAFLLSFDGLSVFAYHSAYYRFYYSTYKYLVDY